MSNGFIIEQDNYANQINCIDLDEELTFTLEDIKKRLDESELNKEKVFMND